jgi:nucleotide-binding universal stress UspA family protein
MPLPPSTSEQKDQPSAQTTLHMLVAVDLDDGRNKVLQTAIEYARRMNAVIDLLHVEPPDTSDFVSYSAGPESVRDSIAKSLHEAHSAVDVLRNKVEQCGVAVRHLITLRGEVFTALKNKVDELKPDLLVLGQSHHHRFFLSFEQSPTERAVANIRCVMMIVPSDLP